MPPSSSAPEEENDAPGRLVRRLARSHDERADVLGDGLGGDAEPLEQLAARSGGAEVVDADRRVDPAAPAHRDSGLDADRGQLGRQNALAVVVVLLCEE